MVQSRNDAALVFGDDGSVSLDISPIEDGEEIPDHVGMAITAAMLLEQEIFSETLRAEWRRISSDEKSMSKILDKYIT